MKPSLTYLLICAVLAASTGAVGWLANQASREAHVAVCNLKKGYEDSLADSKAYLQTPMSQANPSDPEVRLIRNRKDAAEERLKSLNVIDC